MTTVLRKLLLDEVCLALAHPGRRAVLQLLAEHGPLSGARLARAFPAVTANALRKHLRQLERAGLLRALPRQRRRPPNPALSPEQQALEALAQSRVDGRQQCYALVPESLGLLTAWLIACQRGG